MAAYCYTSAGSPCIILYYASPYINGAHVSGYKIVEGPKPGMQYPVKQFNEMFGRTFPCPPECGCVDSPGGFDAEPPALPAPMPCDPIAPDYEDCISGGNGGGGNGNGGGNGGGNGNGGKTCPVCKCPACTCPGNGGSINGGMAEPNRHVYLPEVVPEVLP